VRQPIHASSEEEDEDGGGGGGGGGGEVGFVLNERVDARDYEGKWYVGTIIEIVENEEHHDGGGGEEDHRKASTVRDGNSGGRSGKVLVTFDRWGAKYNEWYPIEEQPTTIKPVYSRTIKPRATMQNCGLRHLHGTKYFGTPRQLWYVKSVFIIHVGCARCVTSSTDNNMKIHAGITLTVEWYTNKSFFIFDVEIQGRG